MKKYHEKSHKIAKFRWEGWDFFQVVIIEVGD